MQVHLIAQLPMSHRAVVADQVHRMFENEISLVTCDEQSNNPSHLMIELEENEIEDTKLIDSVINYSAKVIEYHSKLMVGVRS